MQILRHKLLQWRDSVLGLAQDTWVVLKEKSPGEITRKAKTKYVQNTERVDQTINNSFIFYLIFLIFSIIGNVFYYCLMYFPLNIFSYVSKFFSDMLTILLMRSSNIKKAYVHSAALADVCKTSYAKVMDMKIEDIITAVMQTAKELKQTKNNANLPVKTLTLTEISELLFYEESEEDIANANYVQLNLRMEKYMHNYVSPRLFKATVRSISCDRTPNTTLSTSESSSTTTGVSYYLPVAETKYLEGHQSSEISDNLFANSPLSYPSTPSSRARQLRRHTASVSSELFSARDRLRLEVLMISDDPVSRAAATLARAKSLSASFDPRYLCDGLLLSCGNHCAYKRGLDIRCSSVRAMIPIRLDVYTYFEFSITAANGVSPLLSLGFGPADNSQLNSEVGSGLNSIGLQSDCRLLVEGRNGIKCETNSKTDEAQIKIAGGCTVGVAVLVPSDLSLSKPFVAFNLNGNPLSFDIQENALLKMFGFPASSSDKDNTSSRNNIDISVEYPLGIPTNSNSNSNSNSVNNNIIYNSSNNTNSGGRGNSNSDSNNNSSSRDAALLVLYPTVSILSEGSNIWCRFCEADVLSRDLESIGLAGVALNGNKVYCLDGSVLVDE